ncbi:MAG: hypothetical protein OXG35_32270 [Acidobacteria bacterium]|nr:hypothetical protein [Acidobacteriota bacterium]
MTTDAQPGTTGDDTLAGRLRRDRQLAENRAWKALAGYKFWMFGYWAAWWCKLNALQPPDARRPNPWREIVSLARDRAQQTAPTRKGRAG